MRAASLTQPSPIGVCPICHRCRRPADYLLPITYRLPFIFLCLPCWFVEAYGTESNGAHSYHKA